MGRGALLKRLILPQLCLAAVLALAACGGDTDENGRGSDPTSAPPQPTGAQGVRLEKISVFDPAAGVEAFTMLKPAGWAAEGGVVWRHELSNLASSAMQVYNPGGFEALEIFPLVPFTWQDGGIMFFPPGSIYLGSYVKPPVAEPVDYVAQVVLPSFRANVNAQIIGAEEIPAVAQEVAALVQEPGLSKSVRAARVRVEYTLNGTRIHEDFYITLVFSQASFVPGVLWGPERLYSFRAPAGQLEDISPLLHTVTFSTRVNRVWLNQYLQVVDLWVQGQMQAIQSAGELSRYIAQVSDEIREITTQTYERQQAANDRISENFSEAIRGVETYEHPFEGRDIELPSGFNEVWASQTGEFFLSNNVGFDPNVGSTVNWELMRAR